MAGVGLAWTLTLMSAYLLGGEPPPFPPTYTYGGMSNEELWNQIVTNSGNPLGQMSFDEAAATDPRRIEGLISQRVIYPLLIGLERLEHPQVNIDTIRAMMRHAYLENAHRLIDDGRPITAQKIANTLKQHWRSNSEVLRVAFELRSEQPESHALRALFSSNRQDIRRAFRESADIAARAARAVPKDSLYWCQDFEILKNMSDTIERYAIQPVGGEIVDDEVLWIQPVPAPDTKMGAVSSEDLFGALSFDEAVADAEEAREEMGAYAWEEYILSGHRAPSIGLPGFERSGGRPPWGLDKDSGMFGPGSMG